MLCVRAAGRAPRELKGLSRDGVMYTIVSLDHIYQSCTMVALPYDVDWCCVLRDNGDSIDDEE